MVKKAQITIFIIVGIILLASVVFISVLTSNDPEDEISENILVQSEIQLVEQEIHSCMDQTIERYLRLFGAEGGALTFIIEDDVIDLPIRTYYDEGRKTMPSIAALETDFSQSIENVMSFCLTSSHPGFTVEEISLPAANTDFSRHTTIVQLDYTIKIEANNKSSSKNIEKFSFSYPFAIEKYLDVASQITNKIQENPDEVDFAHLSRFDIDVAVDPKSSEYFIYSLIDHLEESTNPYVFNFAALFEADELNEAPFFINLEDSYFVQVGDKFREDIHALDKNGDELYYSIDSQHKGFSIDIVTGMLTFNPTQNDIGTHSVEVFVDDGKGLLDHKITRVTVTP